MRSLLAGNGLTKLLVFVLLVGNLLMVPKVLQVRFV